MPVSRTPSSNSIEVQSFADRLAALENERRSRVCLGLDPVPGVGPWSDAGTGGGDPRHLAASAVEDGCRRLIEAAGPHCVAVKPQLARFEALGAPGWAALEAVAAEARSAGLLVVADGKRGDVPVSAEAYAQALFTGEESPWGWIAGLETDAATFNPLMGADSLEPIVDAAASSNSAAFFLVRTSNPGAADVFDLRVEGTPLHELIARMVDGYAERFGAHGMSGAGAVVGATEPRYLERLRELMPRAIFLLPGVGAQGGDPARLAAAFTEPGSALVTASRGIALADDPAEAAARLREDVETLAST